MVNSTQERRVSKSYTIARHASGKSVASTYSSRISAGWYRAEGRVLRNTGCGDERETQGKDTILVEISESHVKKLLYAREGTGYGRHKAPNKIGGGESRERRWSTRDSFINKKIWYGKGPRRLSFRVGEAQSKVPMGYASGGSGYGSKRTRQGDTSSSQAGEKRSEHERSHDCYFPCCICSMVRSHFPFLLPLQMHYSVIRRDVSMVICRSLARFFFLYASFFLPIGGSGKLSHCAFVAGDAA